MIAGNEYMWADYAITTTSLIYSNDFMSIVWNMMAVAGVQLFNWTISLALANPFSPCCFVHAMCVAHPTWSEVLPILMRSKILAEPL